MSARTLWLTRSYRAWMAYVLLMGLLSALCFADLASHGTNNHDAETFRDNARITQDFSYFFSLNSWASSRPSRGRPNRPWLPWSAPWN